MSDTVTVTIQTGNGAASAQSFDFNNEGAAPMPPMEAGDMEMDSSSPPAPPAVDEDDASSEALSASGKPSPPGFDEDTSEDSGGSEDIADDDSGAPAPPEV